jgi:predicted Zn-dependent protease
MTAPNPDSHAASDPEARGFGRRPGRLRIEIAVLGALLLGLPALLIWGARAAAETLAMRLPPEMDARLGRPTWLAIEASADRCPDPALAGYVERLAVPLLAALGDTPYEFRFLVVRDEAVNAFALPGGFVVVNRGLLESAESGDEVAAVLAHELSHVTARHSTRRLASQLGVSTALSLLFGWLDVTAPALALSQLSGLAYGRSQEAEADELALSLLRRAGIAPAALGTFFARLEGAARPPEVLSTHPDPGDRAERARRAAEGFAPTLPLPAPPRVVCAE